MKIKEECRCDFPMTTSFTSPDAHLQAGTHYRLCLYSVFKSQFAFTGTGHEVYTRFKSILSRAVLSKMKGMIPKRAGSLSPVYIFKHIINCLAYHASHSPNKSCFYYKWLKDCLLSFWFQTYTCIFEQQNYTESPPYDKPLALKRIHYLILLFSK